MKVRTSLLFPLAAVGLLAANFNTSAQTWETILDKGSLTGTLEGQCIFIDPMSTASPALPNLFTGGLGDNGNVLLLNQSPSSYFVGDAAKGRSFQVAEVPIGSSRLYSVGSLFGGNPSSSWIAAKGGASLATGIAADGQGNIFVCGATGTHWEPRSWVVRKSSDGGATWTTILDRWALGLLGTAESVALDPAGNVWLAGWHKADSFATYIWTVARLDKLNSWARTYDQPNLGNGLPHGITSDANGNVYVTGSLKADANSNGRWVVQRLLFP